MFTETANRRYTIWTVGCWTGYLIISSAAMAGANHASGAATWGLGLMVALPVAAHVWATLVLVRDADEFARALTAKRFVLAWGLCLVLFAAWGFMESYSGVAHAPGWLLYPLFWVTFGIVSLFVHSSR